MLKPNSTSGTFLIALILCLVCSVVVSSVAVGLRGRQQENKRQKLRRNVLIAAGLWDADAGNEQIDEKFEQVETVLVNLPPREESGIGDGEVEGLLNTTIDVGTYDARKASTQPVSSVEIPPELDLAGIKRRERVAPVYVVRDEAGNFSKLVLPVNGKGLWSTLYGFIALDADLVTIRGITFYDHAETPGLGGEITNPVWQQQWDGKIAFDEDGRPWIDVVKGSVVPGNPAADRQIDGLSGATITSVGVENLVNYWLGPDAFGPFLDAVRTGELDLTSAAAQPNASAEEE
ncbi:MAG: Na(+)-translocating NADH-quinone reductase subunit C [Planctomycetota bacterium]|nr:MAG: Na(+)-translocating NADH-quinone reductase subunit C [Planctomycetota bacterium]